MEDTTPDQPTVPSSAPIPSFTPPISHEPSVSSTPPAPEIKSNSHKSLTVIVIVIILLVAAGVIAYSLKSNTKQSGTVKKDIPYLSYGFSGVGDLSQTYPTETADDSNTQIIDAQLFEGLVRYEDQTKIVPWLATSWSNPNDTTWIFNLRHGVKFHDGRTMTATDVAYSLNYAVENQNVSGGSTNLALASSIDTVKALQPYQVQVTTNGPDAVLLNRLASLSIFDSKAKLGDPNAGTGPYTVKGDSIKSNATSIDLLAFNGYWAGHVYTRQLHIQEDPSVTQMANDVINGKLDLAGDFPSQDITRIKAHVKYYQPITVPDLGVSFLNLNTEKKGSPLSSLAARQAITYALNIPAILKAGGINGTQASQLIPSDLPGHDPSITPTPYNPTKAKQLLSSVPNLSTPLTLSYPTGDDGQVGAIASQLDAVGFNIKLVKIGDVGTLAGMMVAGQGDMFYLTYTSNTLDGLDMIESIVASGTADYNNSELNNLVSQAGSTLDPGTRIAALQKIEQIIAADVPTVSLYNEVRTFALTKQYVLNDNLPSTDTGTYFSQVYQK